MKVIQSSVVRALVAIVVGVMLILYRKATLEWMVIITGALFFLSGCLSCLAYYWGRRKAIRAAQVIDEEDLPEEALRVRAVLGAVSCSTMVFQAPQAGHFPDHFGVSLPHSVQKNVVLLLATARLL